MASAATLWRKQRVKARDFATGYDLLAVGEPGMRLKFAVGAAIHTDRDLARDAFALQPVLGSHGLYQAVGTPREPGGDAGDNIRNPFNPGAGARVSGGRSAARGGGVEGKDTTRPERQVAEAREGKFTDGAQTGWQQGEPLCAPVPSRCGVLIHAGTRHIWLRRVKAGFRARSPAERSAASAWRPAQNTSRAAICLARGPVYPGASCERLQDRLASAENSDPLPAIRNRPAGGAFIVYVRLTWALGRLHMSCKM